jgi:ribosome biogenesis protein MAK21
MLSALLSGISRAFPFAPTNDQKYEEHINSLFRMVHVTTFNKSVQALLVLLQLLFSEAKSEPKTDDKEATKIEMDPEQQEAHKQRMESVAKRFYRALYSKMLSTELFNSSKQPLFLNILFKSIKLDTSTPRVKAFVKRLLQVHTRSVLAPRLWLIDLTFA